MVALHLFNKFQVSQNNPTYLDLTGEDIVADNLQYLFGRYGIWLSSLPIPRYHDGNFVVQASMSGKATEYLQPEAKKKYFKRLKAVMKMKFSSYEDWKSKKRMVGLFAYEFCCRVNSM